MARKIVRRKGFTCEIKSNSGSIRVKPASYKSGKIEYQIK